MTHLFEFHAKTSLLRRNEVRQCSEAIKKYDEQIHKLDAEIIQAENVSRFARLDFLRAESEYFLK